MGKREMDRAYMGGMDWDLILAFGLGLVACMFAGIFLAGGEYI